MSENLLTGAKINKTFHFVFGSPLSLFSFFFFLMSIDISDISSKFEVHSYRREIKVCSSNLHLFVSVIGYGIFYWICAISLPISFVKNSINVIQLFGGFKVLAELDVDSRKRSK